tara:strand:- start:748 stop:945 length:198 start_codon:yes stop_codon:yes gene_type:complete
MNGGYPPIKKTHFKKKVNNKNLKKFKFSTINVDNVSLKDILSLVKIKKTSEKIINDEEIETVNSI